MSSPTLSHKPFADIMCLHSETQCCNACSDIYHAALVDGRSSFWNWRISSGGSICQSWHYLMALRAVVCWLYIILSSLCTVHSAHVSHPAITGCFMKVYVLFVFRSNILTIPLLQGRHLYVWISAPALTSLKLLAPTCTKQHIIYCTF